MADVVTFIFNPFQENTFLVIDGNKDCAIFDPGCHTKTEQEELANYIKKHELNPVRLINTHCHIDHVLGNKFIAERYHLPLEIHRGESHMLEMVPQSAPLFGITYNEPSPKPGKFLEEGEIIEFGSTKLEVIYSPGHSPAGLCFYCEKDEFLIVGDVLFFGSIGRTDLPGGNQDTLINNIKSKLLPLGDDVKVYSGHGPATNICREKRSNPFLK